MRGLRANFLVIYLCAVRAFNAAVYSQEDNSQPSQNTASNSQSTIVQPGQTSQANTVPHHRRRKKKKRRRHRPVPKKKISNNTSAPAVPQSEAASNVQTQTQPTAAVASTNNTVPIVASVNEVAKNNQSPAAPGVIQQTPNVPSPVQSIAVNEQHGVTERFMASETPPPSPPQQAVQEERAGTDKSDHDYVGKGRVGININYPGIGLRWFMSDRWLLELRGQSADNIGVGGLRLCRYMGAPQNKLRIFWGLETDYIRFKGTESSPGAKDASQGNGFAGELLLGGELFVMKKVSLQVDFGPAYVYLADSKNPILVDGEPTYQNRKVGSHS